MDDATYTQLVADLIISEGRRSYPYDDKTGHSIGTLPTGGKLTIGIGWNLSDRGLPDQVIDTLLKLAILEAESVAERLFENFGAFTQNRRSALLELLFNLGGGRFLTFRLMIRAIRNGDWAEAARQAADSRWAQQVQPARVERITRQLREG